MTGRLTRWVKSTLGEERAGTDASDSASETGTPAGLYACPECSKTYIGTDMSSCPTCGDTLEPVPNERDLGML